MSWNESRDSLGNHKGLFIGVIPSFPAYRTKSRDTPTNQNQACQTLLFASSGLPFLPFKLTFLPGGSGQSGAFSRGPGRFPGSGAKVLGLCHGETCGSVPTLLPYGVCDLVPMFASSCRVYLLVLLPLTKGKCDTKLGRVTNRSQIFNL